MPSIIARAAGALRRAIARVIPKGPWVVPWKHRLAWRAHELGLTPPPNFRVDEAEWDGPTQNLAKQVRVKAKVAVRPGGGPGQLDGQLRAYLKGARRPSGVVVLQEPPFIDAAVPTHGDLAVGEPHYFVVHTTSGYGSVESLAHMFLSDGRGFGVQWGIDAKGRMGRFAPGKKTWHVGDQNYRCEGVELVGFAVGESEPASQGGKRWTREDWLALRRNQLDACSWLIAWRCSHLGLPISRAANGDARGFTAERGVVGHINCPANDHVDPGPGWPWDLVLSQAKAWKTSGVPADVVQRLTAARNQKG